MKFSSTGSCLFPRWVCYREAIHTKVAGHLSLMLLCMDTDGSTQAFAGGRVLKEVWHYSSLWPTTLTAAPSIHRAKYSTVFLSPIYSGMCNRSFMHLEENFKVWRLSPLPAGSHVPLSLYLNTVKWWRMSRQGNHYTLASPWHLKHTVLSGLVQYIISETGVLSPSCHDLCILFWSVNERLYVAHNLNYQLCKYIYIYI